MKQSNLVKQFSDEIEEIGELLNHDPAYEKLPQCMAAAATKLQAQSLQIYTALKEGRLTLEEFEILQYWHKLATAKLKYVKELEQIQRNWRNRNENHEANL